MIKDELIDSKDFEKNLETLDEIVKVLESNDLPLDKALEAFEKGINVYKNCQTSLSAANEKVKILIESSSLGEMIEVDFEEKDL